MNSKDITIILPVHDVSDDFNNWFPKSLKSLEQSQIEKEDADGLMLC